jgi:sugar lactone lactonase YvrE
MKNVYRVFLCSIIFIAIAAFAQSPEISFEKMIGDVRGHGMNNLSVAATDNGEIFLLMRSGRLSRFGPDGKYISSRQLPEVHWPTRGYYLSSAHGRIFLGNLPEDFPELFLLKRKGETPGKFRDPRGAAIDENGRVFVADAGNRRVQVFEAGKIGEPTAVLTMEAKPYSLGVRGSSLAILSDDRILRLYEVSGKEFKLCAEGKVGPGAHAVAIEPSGGMLVAYNSGPNRFQLERHKVQEKEIVRDQVIAPPWTDLQPDVLPDDTPLVTGPDGHVWFTSQSWGRVLALNPETDRVTVKIEGLTSPQSLQFDGEGRLYVGLRKPVILRFDPPEYNTIEGRSFLKEGKLYGDTAVPVWGLLPDSDGGVYVRVVEVGWRKGWPAITFKKVFPNGEMKPLLDFGPMFAKRTRFGPWEARYSMLFDEEGDIILAALPLVSVMKVKPDGTIIWEAGLKPQGGADVVEFQGPCDIAVDSKGRIWGADVRKNKIFCLSSKGQLLLEYGGYADIDDREGKGFDNPTGITVAKVGDDEYVYVADAGNQRLIKYRIVK